MVKMSDQPMAQASGNKGVRRTRQQQLKQTPEPSPQTSDSFSESDDSSSTSTPMFRHVSSQFVHKLYDMATCPKHSTAFGWSANGLAIEIRDEELLPEVLKMYFKHSNINSFIRQLNNYGFTTIPNLRNSQEIVHTFAHPNFRRDSRHLLESITRSTAKATKKRRAEIVRDMETTSADIDYRQKFEDLDKTCQLLVERVKFLESENSTLKDYFLEMERGRISMPSCGFNSRESRCQHVPSCSSEKHQHSATQAPTMSSYESAGQYLLRGNDEHPTNTPPRSDQQALTQRSATEVYPMQTYLPPLSVQQAYFQQPGLQSGASPIASSGLVSWGASFQPPSEFSSDLLVYMDDDPDAHQNGAGYEVNSRAPQQPVFADSRSPLPQQQPSIPHIPLFCTQDWTIN